MEKLIEVNKIYYEQFLETQIDYNKQSLQRLREDKRSYISNIKTLEDKLECGEEYIYYYDCNGQTYSRRKKTLSILQENRNIYI